MPEPLYERAEEIDIDARMTALCYVLERVKISYAGEPISLRNVAGLVDGIADGLAKDDLQMVIVRGLRLLSLPEVDHVVGILRVKPIPTVAVPPR